MAANIPTLEHVMTVKAEIEPLIEMGKTPTGVQRVVNISGGTFEGKSPDGSTLKGTIMRGGEDWQLIRDDGVTHLDARYWLQAEDNTIIRVHNAVLVSPLTAKPGEPTPAPYARSIVKLEAPIGPHDWVNKAIFVGTIDANFKQRPAVVTLNFYKVN